MKHLPKVVGGLLATLLAANILAGALSSAQWAFEAADAELTKLGIHEDTILSQDSDVDTGLIGATATVTTDVRDGERRRTVSVKLRKPINLASWQVVEVVDE